MPGSLFLTVPDLFSNVWHASSVMLHATQELAAVADKCLQRTIYGAICQQHDNTINALLALEWQMSEPSCTDHVALTASCGIISTDNFVDARCPSLNTVGPQAHVD